MNFTRLACLASLTCAFTAQARATILIFDVSLTGNDSSRNLTTSPWNAYGDNVNSLTQTIDSTTATYQQGTAFTPNIQLGYFVLFERGDCHRPYRLSQYRRERIRG